VPVVLIVRVCNYVDELGEHIDYCGYAVLPMAIEQDIVLAVAFNNDSLLRLANTDQRYE